MNERVIYSDGYYYAALDSGATSALVRHVALAANPAPAHPAGAGLDGWEVVANPDLVQSLVFVQLLGMPALTDLPERKAA